MRHITFTLSREGGFHPVSKMLADDPAVTPIAILSFNVLADGTVVLLGRFRGNLDRMRELLRKRSEVLTVDISREQEGLAYFHMRQPDSMEWFMRIPREHKVFFEMPFERVTGDDLELRVTMIGESNRVLQRALADAPDDVEVTYERMGEYPPDVDGLSSLLTHRQREVLAVAVEGGYYEIPRQATQRDIADYLGVTVGTVSEHLRRIESRILSAVNDRSAAP